MAAAVENRWWCGNAGDYFPVMERIEIIDGGGQWEARDGAVRIGRLRAITRPDQRTFLSFRDCRGDAYAPLLARAVAKLDRALLHTWVAEQDEAELRRLGQLGFMVSRREHRYRIPVAPARIRFPDAVPLSGIRLISAADADLDRLRLLDDTLRDQTPGTDGWQWTPTDFREETFSDGFHAATYRVAVEEWTGGYIGLVRVWLKQTGPRFGFIGVLPCWRRTRVTYGLLAVVFQELHRRGYPDVIGEIDAANWAANAIAARAGAVRNGGAYELVREVGRG